MQDARTLARHVSEFLRHGRWRSALRTVPLLLLLSVIAFVPAQLIAILVQTSFPGPMVHDVFATPAKTFTTLVTLPFLETCAMYYLFRLLRRFIKSPNLLCLVSGLIWILPHIRSPSWGLHTPWAFFIYGRTFLHFEKISFTCALTTTSIVHSLFNVYAYFWRQVLKWIFTYG